MVSQVRTRYASPVTRHPEGRYSHDMVNARDAWVTTANGFEGYKIDRYLGIVRGVTVRSASALGNLTAGIQGIFGGNVQAYTELAENSRYEAYELMIGHAAQMGANAVIAMRYDATEVANGMTEVLAYGTAVVIEKLP